jgi:cytoskeletal protein RodZ
VVLQSCSLLRSSCSSTICGGINVANTVTYNAHHCCYSVLMAVDISYIAYHYISLQCMYMFCVQMIAAQSNGSSVSNCQNGFNSSFPLETNSSRDQSHNQRFQNNSFQLDPVQQFWGHSPGGINSPLPSSSTEVSAPTVEQSAHTTGTTAAQCSATAATTTTPRSGSSNSNGNAANSHTISLNSKPPTPRAKTGITEQVSLYYIQVPLCVCHVLTSYTSCTA